jgi:hypothetical protein
VLHDKKPCAIQYGKHSPYVSFVRAEEFRKGSCIRKESTLAAVGNLSDFLIYGESKAVPP